MKDKAFYVTPVRESRGFRARGLLAVLLGSVVAARAQQDSAEVVVSGAIAGRIDAYLERMIAFGFSGAVLVELDDRVVLAKGYGLADDSTATPCTPQTVFELASVSKQFTAAAILELQAQGRLHVDSTLGDVFDDVPDDKRDITLHQLLSHTSGLISGTTTVLRDSSRAGLLREVLGAPLSFAPGSRFAYSNHGFNVAAAVVEKVSGEDFDAFLREHVFEPSGMLHTGIRPRLPAATAVAHRYVAGNDGGTIDSDRYPDWNRMGGGGLHSTLWDMLRWKRAITGRSLLPAELRDAMFTPVRNDYGYGLRVVRTGNGTVIEHNGGSSRGYACRFRVELDAGNTLIAFCNRDGERVLFTDGLIERIQSMMAGAELGLPPRGRRQADVDLRPYEGAYRGGSDTVVTVAVESGMLRIAVTGQAAVDVALDLPDRGEYAELSATAAKVLADLDGALAERTMTPNLRRLVRQRSVSAPASSGTFREFAVLGTVPDWVWGGSESMTIVELRFAGRTDHCRLHWKDGRVIALGGAGVRVPASLWGVADGRAPGSFAGFHCPTGASPTLRFRRDGDGRATEVVIGERVTARR